jgi:hypothetical protein
MIIGLAHGAAARRLVEVVSRARSAAAAAEARRLAH